MSLEEVEEKEKPKKTIRSGLIWRRSLGEGSLENFG